MPLPNFINFEPFNNLRRRMHVEGLGKFSEKLSKLERMTSPLSSRRLDSEFERRSRSRPLPPESTTVSSGRVSNRPVVERKRPTSATTLKASSSARPALKGNTSAPPSIIKAKAATPSRKTSVGKPAPQAKATPTKRASVASKGVTSGERKVSVSRSAATKKRGDRG